MGVNTVQDIVVAAARDVVGCLHEVVDCLIDCFDAVGIVPCEFTEIT